MGHKHQKQQALNLGSKLLHKFIIAKNGVIAIPSFAKSIKYSSM